MKKIISISLVFLGLLFIYTGCGNPNKKDISNMKLEEIMDYLYTGIEEDEMPEVTNTEINDSNIEYYLGVQNLEIEEGIASEPLMGSYAHSIVIIKLKDGENVKNIKNEIKENVNPRKWICVEAEDVTVESKGNIIILIMSNKELSSKMKNNLNNLK